MKIAPVLSCSGSQPDFRVFTIAAVVKISNGSVMTHGWIGGSVISYLDIAEGCTRCFRKHVERFFDQDRRTEVKAYLVGAFFAALGVSSAYAGVSQVNPDGDGGYSVLNSDGSSSRVDTNHMLSGGYTQLNADGSSDDIEPTAHGGYTVFHHAAPKMRTQ